MSTVKFNRNKYFTKNFIYFNSNQQNKISFFLKSVKQNMLSTIYTNTFFPNNYTAISAFLQYLSPHIYIITFKSSHYILISTRLIFVAFLLYLQQLLLQILHLYLNILVANKKQLRSAPNNRCASVGHFSVEY